MTEPDHDQDPADVDPILITMPDGAAVTERDIDRAIAAATARQRAQAPAVPQYAVDAAAAVLTARLHGGMSVRDVPDVARAMLAAGLQGTGLTLMHVDYLGKHAREGRALITGAEQQLDRLRAHFDTVSPDPAPRKPPAADPDVWPAPTMVDRQEKP